MSKRLVSKHVVYDRLGISRDALKSLREAGVLKYQVVDRRNTRHYCLDSLNEFIEKRK
jgi:ribosomal protein S25